MRQTIGKSEIKFRNIVTQPVRVEIDNNSKICYYESDGQLLNGTWGTNPYAIERFFKQRGYEVSRVEGDDILNNKTPDADAYIFSYWNSDKVSESLHTVAVRKTEIGRYVLYNYGDKRKNQKNGDSIQEIMIEENRQPVVLITINKRNKE